MSTHSRMTALFHPIVVGVLSLAIPIFAKASEPREGTANSGADSSPQVERVLLLGTGQVVRGMITQEGSFYVVRQTVGTMKFPKNRVDGAFDSIEAAYDYRLEQLPENDSDERFKLARWCLSNKLTEQARTQLQKVLELNSKNIQARAMLTSIEQESIRMAQRQRDPEVRQTGAVMTANENRPGTLDSAVIQGAQQYLGISGIPVIFDLPRPLAVKRTQEFARFVHPLLQVYCAKCHDGEYQGKFQLVPVRKRGDRSPDALRANLDATLQFIDPQSPAKSELLSSMLRPHGRGPNKRPIFPGSNNQAYQVIAAWVSQLRSAKVQSESAITTARRPDEGDTETEGFAVEHDRATRGAVSSDSRVLKPDLDRTAKSGKSSADPAEFPLPVTPTEVNPLPKPAPFKLAVGTNQQPPQSLRDPVIVDPSTKKAKATGAETSAAKSKKPDPSRPKTKAAEDDSKPLAIDPALLQKALESRLLNR